MDELDESVQANPSKSTLLVPDTFNNVNEPIKELQNCFSKLKIGYITEKELRKQQQKTLENIKNIYEEVFGENSFRPSHIYSEIQMHELNNEMYNDKNQDMLYGESSQFKTDGISVQNPYRDFEEFYHKQNTKTECSENSRITNSARGSCNKCKAMHPDFFQYFEEKPSNVNIKCTNISKSNFVDQCKSHNNTQKAQYVNEMNSFLHHDKNKRDFEKLKVCSESLDDKKHDINDSISRELAKLYNLKEMLKQLEEYDRQMNKKINDALKQYSHSSKLNKGPNFEEKFLKKKVTVPQPFNLSQTKKCKSSDVKQIDNQETFHANPIPNHIYQPLYKEFIENEERRKTERKAANTKKLKTFLKPYHLSTKESQNHKNRFQSVPDLRDINVVSAHFKAKPVPCFMHNQNFTEKQKEEEKKRSIRIKQRSETLLKQSALPFSERKVIQSKRAQNLSKSLDDLNKNSGNKQELNNKIYETFRNKTTTVCQPFRFRTEERHLNKIKNLKTLYENEYISCTACNTPKKIPFQIERPTSAPLSYPVNNKRTNSSALRDHYIRHQLCIKQEEMEQELQILSEKLQRENCFFNMYGWKFKMLDSTENVKKAIQEKLKSNRKMALQRQHEYKMELKEMKERVHKRPLLVEMQAVMSQKGRLEKCYNQALERAGINNEFVEELSGRYKDWENHKLYDTAERESSNSDTSCSEQASEINNNDSHASQDTTENDDKSDQNSQHSSKSDDDYVEHSSDVDLTSHCSQQSVISNKELVHRNNENNNAVP